ncbi:putative ankyrin repeat and zinc finger domain protein [Trypanosoma grayi]|uniref:putative ankyrin repeat and zinc finger domain protein n=1 Tax=Trypanosoma grayi TaxID=71804 RepID=UPI0004F4009E|nr:putative ankyrin repeat and zinc finger domain protein [Trypanosoma grayi]KEG14926.1 putative ankyrin repeat and zinc finger domain protein [Trypanosoma grayi]
MSSVAEIEQLLAATRKSLAIPPRNAYEAENAYISNVERLKEARQKLGRFSGDYVERLLGEMDKLEQEVNAAVLKQCNPVDVLLEVDFAAEEEEKDEDEVEAVKREMEKKREGKKKQGGRKPKSKKVQHRAGSPEADAVENEPHQPQPPMQQQQRQKEEEEYEKKTAEVEAIVVARYADCNSSEIPQEAIGPGRCALIPNSPLVQLNFATPVEYDGHPCLCRVIVHRAVVIALAYGEPVAGVINVASEGGLSPTEAAEEPQDSVGALVESAEKVVEDDVVVESDEESLTVGFSKQLIAEYDALLEEEEEEEESSAKLLPTDVPTRLRTSLRSLTFLPWVILMCHGGYFAGGVFVDGKPVAHKAFQRYVVRKKQGGKQSSNEKEGGSYGSIGSQIRRAQEIKWRLEVRDILLKWRSYINAAAVVLYVAPGPQNRGVLTDFSSLPAITTENGERAVSPVNLKDPRVRKAPLTTHRPSFQEVQRTYKTVSTCTVEYVKYME